jgi:DNA-binding LytR/AlgR family response regulator
MTTALICDDEPLMRANLREHLHVLWPELQVVGEAQDGPEALRMIAEHNPGLAFLDIQMPGMTGLQVGQLVGPATKIVFVTAFDSHALEAFELNAVDYLLKPISLVRLGKLITRLRQQSDSIAPHATLQLQELMRQLAAKGRALSPATLDWLQVDVGRQLRMVHVDDAIYFESDSKYTRVVADDCDGLIRMSLKELLAALDPRQFQQVHRSVVVNRRFIRGVNRHGEAMDIELRGRDERLRVSESNQHLFRAM